MVYFFPKLPDLQNHFTDLQKTIIPIIKEDQGTFLPSAYETDSKFTPTEPAHASVRCPKDEGGGKQEVAGE